VKWPRLSDDTSDTRDVREFYETFEDVCGLANDCNGMGPEDMLLALRPLCTGSRLKSFMNIYKRESRAGTVRADPAKVYQLIKAKHLLFTESADEKELRASKAFNACTKGKLLGHQFEPLFEAAVADLEEVGLGKSQRELCLAYVDKIGPKLAQVVRRDKRLWEQDDRLRGPETWEEAHHVVLEFEQTEHVDKVAAGLSLSTDGGAPTKEMKKLQTALDQANKKLLAADSKIAAFSGGGGKPGGKPGGPGGAGGDGPVRGVCHWARDHGSCKDEKNCKSSHDPELLKRARAEKKLKDAGTTAGGDNLHATNGGSKGKGKGAKGEG